MYVLVCNRTITVKFTLVTYVTVGRQPGGKDEVVEKLRARPGDSAADPVAAHHRPWPEGLHSRVPQDDPQSSAVRAPIGQPQTAAHSRGRTQSNRCATPFEHATLTVWWRLRTVIMRTQLLFLTSTFMRMYFYTSGRHICSIAEVSKIVDMYLFLFDDIFLLTKLKKSPRKVRRILAFLTMYIMMIMLMWHLITGLLLWPGKLRHAVLDQHSGTYARFDPAVKAGFQWRVLTEVGWRQGVAGNAAKHRRRSVRRSQTAHCPRPLHHTRHQLPWQLRSVICLTEYAYNSNCYNWVNCTSGACDLFLYESKTSTFDTCYIFMSLLKEYNMHLLAICNCCYCIVSFIVVVLSL